MATNRFLERASRVLEDRAAVHLRGQHRTRQRILGIGMAVVLAGAFFFVLKGVAMATGTQLNAEASGIAYWLAGPDPISSSFGAAFEPIFSGRV